MARFKVDIEKGVYGHELPVWTNNYHINADSVDDAVTAGSAIVSLELNLHTNHVFFHRMRVSTVQEHDNVFTTLPLNEQGNQIQTGNILPYQCAMILDMSPTFGRNGRKYYHVLANEASQADSLWDNDWLSNQQDLINVWFSNTSNPILLSPNGLKIYRAGVFKPDVGYHQFRRGSKRRVPILP